MDPSTCWSLLTSISGLVYEYLKDYQILVLNDKNQIEAYLNDPKAY